MDPFMVQGGQNLNHPRNVEICGQAPTGRDPSWVFENGFMQEGEVSWATIHGNGQVCGQATGEVLDFVDRGGNERMKPTGYLRQRTDEAHWLLLHRLRGAMREKERWRRRLGSGSLPC
jgi:hypothetical protein